MFNLIILSIPPPPKLALIVTEQDYMATPSVLYNYIWVYVYQSARSPNSQVMEIKKQLSDCGLQT
jgi:hypothetical protein